MKNRGYRLLSIALFLVVVIGLSACGSAAGEQSELSETTDTAAAEPADEETAGKRDLFRRSTLQ